MFIVIAYRSAHPLCSYRGFRHFLLGLSYDELSVNRVFDWTKNPSVYPIGIFHRLHGRTNWSHHCCNRGQAALLRIFNRHVNQFIVRIFIRNPIIHKTHPSEARRYTRIISFTWSTDPKKSNLASILYLLPL